MFLIFDRRTVIFTGTISNGLIPSNFLVTICLYIERILTNTMIRTHRRLYLFKNDCMIHHILSYSTTLLWKITIPGVILAAPLQHIKMSPLPPTIQK